MDDYTLLLLNFYARVEADLDGSCTPTNEHAMDQICSFIDEAGTAGCQPSLHARCVLKLFGQITSTPFPSGGVVLFTHLESEAKLFLIDKRLNMSDAILAIERALKQQTDKKNFN